MQAGKGLFTIDEVFYLCSLFCLLRFHILLRVKGVKHGTDFFENTQPAGTLFYSYMRLEHDHQIYYDCLSSKRRDRLYLSLY